MIEEQPIQLIEIKDLVQKVSELRDQKYRLVQIGCTKLKEGYEINYVFDKDYQFQALRIQVPAENIEIPSVSNVYPSAFLYENEIHDLYGLTVTDMSLDYKGTFYRTSVRTPFR
jgi:ech hydrogenase subunit D